MHARPPTCQDCKHSRTTPEPGDTPAFSPWWKHYACTYYLSTMFRSGVDWARICAHALGMSRWSDRCKLEPLSQAESRAPRPVPIMCGVRPTQPAATYVICRLLAHGPHQQQPAMPAAAALSLLLVAPLPVTAQAATATTPQAAKEDRRGVKGGGLMHSAVMGAWLMSSVTRGGWLQNTKKGTGQGPRRAAAASRSAKASLRVSPTLETGDRRKREREKETLHYMRCDCPDAGAATVGHL